MKPRGRPFEQGNKYGRGRPKGSKNRNDGATQKLLDDYAEHVLRKCLAMAMEGNSNAMRLCVERISPARRDVCVRMNLPPIKTAEDVDRAAEKVTQAMRRGDLSPSEGQILMNILEGRARIIEKVELENRIAKLEESFAANTQSHLNGAEHQNPRTAGGNIQHE